MNECEPSPSGKPVRVVLRRTKGWRIPRGTVKVDRTTRWGNPFIPGQPAPFGPTQGQVVTDRRHAYRLYSSTAPYNPALCAAARAELKGRNLACWCHLVAPYADECHASVLLTIANSDPQMPADELASLLAGIVKRPDPATQSR